MKKKPIRLRPELRRFAEMMELKLRKNDHKGGWLMDDERDLLIRMVEEQGELAKEVDRGSPERAAAEAVDVANFAMMIAGNALGPMDQDAEDLYEEIESKGR